MTHIRDYPVERRSPLTKATLAGSKLAEVLGSFWNIFVVKFEDNPPGRFSPRPTDCVRSCAH
jgi:hypothetical protein